MCRALEEGGRRCPSDISLARKLRHMSFLRREAFTKKLAHRYPAANELRAVSDPVLVAETKAKISDMNDLLNQGDATSAEVACREIGRKVEEIANRKGDFQARIEELQSEKDELLKTAVPALTRWWREMYRREHHPQEQEDETDSEWMKTAEECHRIDNEIKTALAQRSLAYRQALEDVGVKMGMVGQVNLDQDSGPSAMAALGDACQNFPSSWVDASNKFGQMRGRYIWPGRAHYRTSRWVNTKVRTADQNVVLRPKGWKPDPQDPSEAGMQVVKDGRWALPGKGDISVRVDDKTQTAWLSTEYEFSETPRRAKGWEKIKTATGKNVWRKEKELVFHEEGGKPFIRVGPGRGITSHNKGLAVATHEFSHRVEHVIPKITDVEQAFLDRRANGEKPSEIYRSRDEMGIKDNFRNHYMGKIYPSRFREILSMGMETTFEGKNGGFISTKNDDGDADYRTFVLGALTIKP